MSKRHSRRTFKIHRRTPPGASPGQVVSDPQACPTEIRLIAYGPAGFVEERLRDPEQIPPYLERYPVVWVDVDGLGNADAITRLGKVFNLHPLSLEDVVNVHQRPKVEAYPGYLFIVAVMVCCSPTLEQEQFSLFCGQNFVLTFQERPGGDSFEPVRQRLRAGRGLHRESGPDYLTYSLLDAVVDAYFPVLERYSERLEKLEEEVLSHPHQRLVRDIHDAKHDLLLMLRLVWPLREALNTLIRDPAPEIRDATRVYLRDCYDHSVQILDLLELYRELGSDLINLYLSNVSNRMNDIMRVLTVIATIFIPLTFIVGIYGMNFDPESSPWNMPELRMYYGYPVTWLVMLATAAGFLWFFYRKGWLHSLSDMTAKPAAHKVQQTTAEACEIVPPKGRDGPASLAKPPRVG